MVPPEFFHEKTASRRKVGQLILICKYLRKSTAFVKELGDYIYLLPIRCHNEPFLYSSEIYDFNEKFKNRL